MLVYALSVISPCGDYFRSAGQYVQQALNALTDIPCRTFFSVDGRQFFSLLPDIYCALNPAGQCQSPLPNMSGIFREDCPIVRTRLIPRQTYFSVYERQILNPVGQNSLLLAREGVSLLRSAVGKTHVLRSGLVMDYSEIGHIHLSIEAQCVTTLLPLGDCHNRYLY